MFLYTEFKFFIKETIAVNWQYRSQIDILNLKYAEKEKLSNKMWVNKKLKAPNVH